MLDAIRGIQRGLDAAAEGRGSPAREVLERIRAKYKIPRVPR
jgi:predicted transcriptional regulator